MKYKISKTRIISMLSVLFLFLTWKTLAWYYSSEQIVPSPESTLFSIFKILSNKDFLIIIGSTTLRGIIGFLISFVLGIALGVFAGINSSFKAFLSPVLVTIRSTPVISLILLALIWFKVDMVAVFIAFLTMFPFICTNVMDGIKNVDKELIEMSKVYHIPQIRIIKEVYLPAITPFIFSGASSAMGFGWRAVIIGEVLSLPRYGIGTFMQTAQTYLLVSEVIAWTLIAIVVSYLFELMIRSTEKWIVNWK